MVIKISRSKDLKDQYIFFKGFLFFSTLFNVIYLFTLEEGTVVVKMLIPNLLMIGMICVLYGISYILWPRKVIYIISVILSTIIFTAILLGLTYIMLYEVQMVENFIFFIPLIVLALILGIVNGLKDVKHVDKFNNHLFPCSTLLFFGLAHVVFKMIFNMIGQIASLYVVLVGINIMTAIFVYLIAFWVMAKKYDCFFKG